MAVVSKKKPVASNTPATTKTTNTVEKKTVAPVKKTETKQAPVKKAETNKKLTLKGEPKAPKSFEIREGSQATQDAFIDRFYKKFCKL